MIVLYVKLDFHFYISQTLTVCKGLMNVDFFMSRIEKILQYLESAPADNFLRHALALEYIKMGDDLKAKELFENILAEYPDYTGSYYHLGKLLERIGETD